jgi:hypothetical protein
MKWRFSEMDNKGQITVFLCLLMTSMLLIGLTALELVRIHIGRAKVAEAARGAASDVEAAYCAELFEKYHLLAIDKNFGGQGEGKIEQLAQDYLEYTLTNDQEDSMEVSDVAVTDYCGLLDDDCENMKKQVEEYMKISLAADEIEKLTGDDSSDVSEEKSNSKKSTTTDSDKQTSKSKNSILDYGNENSDSSGDAEEDWSGEDPRDTLKRITESGLLRLVTPDGSCPSKDTISLDNLPSKNKVASNSADEDYDLIEEGVLDNIDVLKKQLGTTETDSDGLIKENLYGIKYALKCFSKYTDGETEGPLQCEVEYIIAGYDNDYDNLQSVVNRIMIHRFPLNYVSISKNEEKVAEVEIIAAVVAIFTGIDSSEVKQLLLGCWAYAETLVDIRILLSGKSVQLVKDSENWITDIDGFAKLALEGDEGYTGADAISYEDYLAIFLAEKAKNMYFRMADVIQINLSQGEDSILMSNMIYACSMDIVVNQNKKYSSFVESVSGVNKIDSGLYQYECSVTTLLQ